ncbi:MAG: glycosyltransferase [Oscillospiraceae bacterium]|nr:glycosyltransferase [Oscillospiraceae bacterium]
MEPKISFIVPVYNVERYISQCLDSILCQAGEDCEVIVVDDGATDSSGVLCDRYGNEYENVTVIHKPNGGLSSARNAGMEAAKGQYVCFVDSDDYIAGGAVAQLLQWMDGSEADIVFLRCDKFYPDGSTEPMADGVTAGGVRGKEKAQVLEFLADCPKYPGSAWAKLFLRDFLTASGLRFPDDRRLSEDLIYCLNAFLAAERFDALECPFYLYRQGRTDSITNNISSRYYFDTTLFITEVVQRFARDKAPVSGEGACALSFAAFEYVILAWQQAFLSGEDGERAYRFLKEYRWILKYGRSARTRLVRTVSSVIGLRATTKLLNFYMKNRR